jgi:hypothetical protein
MVPVVARAAFVGLAVVSSSLVLIAGTAGARVSSAHVDSNCTANTPFGVLPQVQPFDLDVNAPLETADTSPFTVTIPGGTTTLANRQAGFPVVSYSGAYTTYQVAGGTIVSGSATAAGAATWNNGSGPQSTSNDVTELSSTLVESGVPGTLTTGGHNIALTTPDVTFQVQPDALNTPVFIEGHEGGSGLVLSIGAVTATCPLLDTVISKTPWRSSARRRRRPSRSSTRPSTARQDRRAAARTTRQPRAP